jgi:hypothetical protein
MATHCLISGIHGKYLRNGILDTDGLGKINTAVRGGPEGRDVRAKNHEYQAISSGEKLPIRPKNFKWGRMAHDRVAYILELETQVEVGVGLTKAVLAYNRICVSHNESLDKSRIGGEYLIRQYLSLEEADMFVRAEDRKGSESMNDIVLAGLRGLPRVLEIDNGLLRLVKNHYQEATGSQIAVHVLTVRHSQANSTYFDTHADEPIFVVTFLKVRIGFKKLVTHKNYTY